MKVLMRALAASCKDLRARTGNPPLGWNIGEASPKIWSCYAHFKSSLFISLEIDCFHGQLTRKYLHSMTKLSGWLRYWAGSHLIS
jgi:hypothetical protein